MEEKNLITLPSEVVEYLEYMKRNNYTLLGALKISCVTGKFTDYMEDYFSISSNQEKFALAWINGYKEEEKFYHVKFKNMMGDFSYLNYKQDEDTFSLSTLEESTFFKTKFTKEFLEKNSFGWVFDCEGVELIEVDE